MISEKLKIVNEKQRFSEHVTALCHTLWLLSPKTKGTNEPFSQSYLRCVVKSYIGKNIAEKDRTFNFHILCLPFVPSIRYVSFQWD